MDAQAQLQTGMTVFGADNEKIGKIVSVSANHVVVEKGFFFPSDHYVPLTAISSVGDDQVYLSVTKDEALAQGWDQEPAEWSTTSVEQDTVLTDTGTPYADTAYGQADPLAATNDIEVTTETAVDTSDAPYATDQRSTYADTGSSETEVIAADYVASDTRAATGDEAVRVPVYEEDLRAVTRDVERGAVRIEKDVVTEERTISVPVTEERVRVTRVEASDTGAVGDDAFRGGVIEVPIRGQEVEVEKTAHRTGEVLVEKESETRSEQVGGTVRREEVRVDDATIEGDLTDDRRR